MKLTWISKPYYPRQMYVLDAEYFKLRDLLIFTKNLKSGMVYKTTPRFTHKIVFKKYML